MPQHGGENTFGIASRKGEGVGVADASGDDANPYFASFGRGDIDGDQLQRFIGGYATAALDFKVCADMGEPRAKYENCP